jgi:hypothetical protein
MRKIAGPLLRSSTMRLAASASCVRSTDQHSAPILSFRNVSSAESFSKKTRGMATPGKGEEET